MSAVATIDDVRRPNAAPAPTKLSAVLVSYSFPPVGGAGVQRVAKLVKYLPEYGVEPTVLTVDQASVPLLDKSLERDIGANVEVVRARSFEPSYALKHSVWRASAGNGKRGLGTRLFGSLAGAFRQALFPDPQVLWQPAAQAALAGLLRRTTPDVVFVTGPPFSQFLLAPLAAHRAAVVLDYRDEWTTCRETYEMTGPIAARLGDLLEPVLLSRADVVTVATEAFRERLLERFEWLAPERVHTITNGYDRDDLPAHLPELPRDRFVVTYAGTVFRLTSAKSLLAAIRLLFERAPELARLLDVRFVGRIVQTELEHFEGMERYGVRRLDYVEHEKVFDLLGESHLVLCLLDDLPENVRIYPAKLFELMALGRPCLTIAPAGVSTELVERHRFGECVSPRDIEGIATALERRLRAFRNGVVERVEPVGIEGFDRRVIAGRFASVFRQATEIARARRG